MEIRVILRGALSGFMAGVLGFIFARIFAEPVINKAIDYESGRDAALNALNHAAGRPVAPDGPEIFSRSVQSTVGIATGIIAFSTAMGALIAVAYLVMHGRFQVRPRFPDHLPAPPGRTEQILTGKGLNRHIRHGQLCSISTGFLL